MSNVQANPAIQSQSFVSIVKFCMIYTRRLGFEFRSLTRKGRTAASIENAGNFPCDEYLRQGTLLARIVTPASSNL